ncbi:WxL domain-containing protein [Bacillus sp. ISL-34]|uniref:WxL domain-containing protein n=1 Tax=Bacillus sp. ISL-34 TaxID=2819121 RepID=UPI001BE9F68B|nr:WxL domain-containing protein [Bacillus sp. ISL-34]MBT2645280.1 WxL domain-containing protein [Bacillus sp. ISL-34]
MKAITLSIVGSVILVGMIFSTNSAEAAVVNSAISKNYINFIADEGITKPVDPANPDNQALPSPIDPIDPDNGGTGNSGSLTLDYVSNIHFGTQKIMSGNTTYNANNKDPYVQVSDKRGTGEGWALTAKASELKISTGEPLQGAELTFKNGQVKSQSSNVSEPPTAYDVTFDNRDSKKFMDAPLETGRGTWLDVFSGSDGDNSNVQLKVLAGSAEAESYSGTVTWELTNAPS